METITEKEQEILEIYRKLTAADKKRTDMLIQVALTSYECGREDQRNARVRKN